MVMEMGHHHRYLGKVPLSPESAVAADIFDQFVAAQTFKAILATYRHLCDTLRLKPCYFPQFYPKLKAKLPSWKAQALWAKLDKRAAHKCYQRGKACANTRVLIIGGGPCGLRAAIEAQLLGAKVVVIEKRDRFSRNNVLHLWSYVIHDLRALGAKKLFGKFCAGSLDHISIRQLQCILLKISLLLGVEIHESVAFEKLTEPPLDQSEEKIGWRAQVSPADHPVSQYEFDVLIGADGKRNTLRGFKRKEFRGKLAIAITANFINRRSEEEARVEEISGVAFIFNQKFFQDMRETVGIDLENIVYYKDDTHYFVMTAKKHSLIEKGVIINDYSDTAKLLSPDNVDREALMDYAREAADFATNGHLPTLDFAVNHYGQADLAMFDFTSMYAAENACKVLERRGYRLLMGLVGDSLLEPFWPTGSGCARGFLSSLDACWMIRSWSVGVMTPLQVLAQRESVYRLLAQTTPENLSKDHSEHTLNPHSRYPNLNAEAVRPMQVLSLYDSDSPIKEEILEMPVELPNKRQKKDSVIHPNTLLQWCQRQVALYDNVQIENMSTSWKSGLPLCAIIHRYRPDLIDFNSLQADDVVKNNELAFSTCDREFGIPPVMTGEEMLECETPDNLTMVSYVTQLYDIFHGEIPHVRRPMQRSPSDELVSLPSTEKRSSGGRLPLTRIGRKFRPAPERSDRNSLAANLNDRVAKKRRSLDKERAVFITSKENKAARPISLDGQAVKFSERVKTLEELFSGGKSGVESASDYPHRLSSLDLDLRASALNPLNECTSSGSKVGRLDRGDWNLKMLEERLKERNQVKKNLEAVPKWSRECFEDKLKVMTDKSRGQSEERTEKYSDFDQRLHQLDVKLKEGNTLQIGQRGSNKVSIMAEQLASVLDPKQEHAPLNQTNIRPYVPAGGSEKCHFCSKRVYLMERVSAQGKFFHRGCFKCEYCGTTLRLGSYGYAADGNFGGKFLCMQHFGMPLNFTKTRLLRGPIKPLPLESKAGEGLTVLDGVSDKLRGATPERAEFENSSIADQATEDETLSEIDEDEWTDRNFGTSATDMESTDEESDFSSEEISDGDDQAFEEVFNRSITSEETRWLAESWKRKHGQDTGEKSAVEETDEDYVESDDEFSYEPYENEGVVTDSDLYISSPESKPDADEAVPLRSSESEVAGSITSPDSLVRDDSSGAGSEEIASSEEEDDDEEDDGDEDDDSVYGETDEDGEAKKSLVREIPAIIINEFTTNQAEPEVELVNEPIQMEEEIQPLISTAATPDNDVRDIDFRENDTAELSVTLEESSSEAIIMGSDAESSDSTENEIKQDIAPVIASPTPEMNHSFDDMFELDSLQPQFESTPKVVLRKRDIGSVRRELEIKSVIEPLQKPLEDVTINDSSDIKRNEETSPTKTLESASSLPNLTESVIQEEKKEDTVTTSRMLKLKERYLLGETKPVEPVVVACSPEKPSPKMESVFKNVLDLIAEKQKMLTPSPPSVSAFSCSMFNKPTLISPVNVNSTPQVVVTAAEDVVDKSCLSIEQEQKISLRKDNETYEKSTNSDVISTVNENRNEQSKEEISKNCKLEVVEIDDEKTEIAEEKEEDEEFNIDETFITFRKKVTIEKENDESSQSPEIDMDITPTAPENIEDVALIPREEKPFDNINQNKMEKTPPVMIPRYEGGFTKKVSSIFGSFRESLESAKNFPQSPPIDNISTHIPAQEIQTQDCTKVEAVINNNNHVEEIPFADDEDMVQNEENNSKMFGSVSKLPLEKLREFCSVEREKARQQARERARLKSDEELGLSSKLPDCRKKLEEEICSQLREERESTKRTETNSDRRRKSATWSGFGKKQRKIKGSDSNDVNKSKIREPRGLLSMLTNFSKSEGRKNKSRDKTTSSSTSSTKSRSSDTSDSSKDKIRRMLLAHQKLKEKKFDSSNTNNVTEISRDPSAENSRSLSALASSAPKAIEDSFSDSEGEECLPEKMSSVLSSSKRDTEQAEEKLRKLQRIAQKLYRRQEQKRLRVAQEIQRQLEEVEVKQRELEMRGVQVERALRGERDEEGKDETSLMQEWFALVREKNLLVRHEEELLVRAKELELEDRHSRLQQSLSDRIALEDSQKTAEEIEDEGRILTEMLEIGEQRDALGAFLEERFNSSAEGDTKFPVEIEEACSSAKEC